MKKSIESAKIKTNLKVDTFRSTQPLSNPIPDTRIEPVDEGSPMLTNNGILAPKLVLPTSEVFVTHADDIT